MKHFAFITTLCLAALAAAYSTAAISADTAPATPAAPAAPARWTFGGGIRNNSQAARDFGECPVASRPA